LSASPDPEIQTSTADVGAPNSLGQTAEPAGAPDADINAALEKLQENASKGWKHLDKLKNAWETGLKVATVISEVCRRLVLSN
jgi:hypothetical protein